MKKIRPPMKLDRKALNEALKAVRGEPDQAEAALAKASGTKPRPKPLGSK